MKKLPRKARFVGNLLVRDKWESYGVHVDLGITPRSYLTVEGQNRYYLCCSFIKGRWQGHVLLGVSHEGYADSEKRLSEDLLAGRNFQKNELHKAQETLLALGEKWITENDGGVDRSLWEFDPELDVREVPKVPDAETDG